MTCDSPFSRFLNPRQIEEKATRRIGVSLRLSSLQKRVLMTYQFALDTLKEKAEEYIRWDPVVSTREEISQLLKEEDWKALERAIMHRLAFGTAGSRCVEG